jgi:hypothetical protein
MAATVTQLGIKNRNSYQALLFIKMFHSRCFFYNATVQNKNYDDNLSKHSSHDNVSLFMNFAEKQLLCKNVTTWVPTRLLEDARPYQPFPVELSGCPEFRS